MPKKNYAGDVFSIAQITQDIKGTDRPDPLIGPTVHEDVKKKVPHCSLIHVQTFLAKNRYFMAFIYTCACHA